MTQISKICELLAVDLAFKTFHFFCKLVQHVNTNNRIVILLLSSAVLGMSGSGFDTQAIIKQS